MGSSFICLGLERENPDFVSTTVKSGSHLSGPRSAAELPSPRSSGGDLASG